MRRPGDRAGDLPSVDPADLVRLARGQIVRDRYRVNGILDTGRLGTLYRADDLTAHRAVNLRVLDAPVPQADAVVRRFQLRARSGAAPLDTHRTFVTVLDCDLTDEGRLFLALSPVVGARLHDLIHDGKPIELGRALRLAVQIGEGLELAQNLGVLGLDVTSASVVVVGSGDEVTLLESEAVTLHQLRVPLRHAPSAGPSPSRPAAPELAQGGQPTEQSDIYGYGLLVYELLTGTLPTAASRPGASSAAPAPTSLRALRRDVPPAVERVVRRALEEDPGQRPPSMSIVLNELWKQMLNELWMQKRVGVRWMRWRRRVGLVAGLSGVAMLAVWMTVLSRHGGGLPQQQPTTQARPAAELGGQPGELGTTTPDGAGPNAASAATTAATPGLPGTTRAGEQPAGTIAPPSEPLTPVPPQPRLGPSAAPPPGHPYRPRATAPTVPPPRMTSTVESASRSALPPVSMEAMDRDPGPPTPPSPPVRPQPDPTPPSPPPVVQDAGAIIDWVLGQNPRSVP